ncbi:predicted protein [Streptomyces iranensis]|uniref:Uncharacterized protein n=1 Tax=Streptomyces iranensis TaxID=576784 RepID=A0A061A0I8_9ACTN|nr:predicted protein [Streptomyces iranensis]
MRLLLVLGVDRAGLQDRGKAGNGVVRVVIVIRRGPAGLRGFRTVRRLCAGWATGT